MPQRRRLSLRKYKVRVVSGVRTAGYALLVPGYRPLERELLRRTILATDEEWLDCPCCQTAGSVMVVSLEPDMGQALTCLLCGSQAYLPAVELVDFSQACAASNHPVTLLA